jgi:hypothetical protein
VIYDTLNKPFSQEMRKKALVYAAGFDWDEVAKKTLKVYEGS